MKNQLTQFGNAEDFIKSPGDSATVKITNCGRKVVTVTTNHGENKYSATQYPTGTVVETRAYNPAKRK